MAISCFLLYPSDARRLICYAANVQYLTNQRIPICSMLTTLHELADKHLKKNTSTSTRVLKSQRGIQGKKCLGEMPCRAMLFNFKQAIIERTRKVIGNASPLLDESSLVNVGLPTRPSDDRVVPSDGHEAATSRLSPRWPLRTRGLHRSSSSSSSECYSRSATHSWRR